MISAAAAARAVGRRGHRPGRARTHEALDEPSSGVSPGSHPVKRKRRPDLWTETRSLIFEIVGECAVTRKVKIGGKCG